MLPDPQTLNRAPNARARPEFLVRKNLPRFRLNFRFAASDFLRRGRLQGKIHSRSASSGVTGAFPLQPLGVPHVQTIDGNRPAATRSTALPTSRTIPAWPYGRTAIHEEIREGTAKA